MSEAHPQTTTFHLNGVQQFIDLDPDTPLLFVLRNELGQKTVRHGCGEGSCGACTILLDDRATLACQITLGQTQGSTITTAEGLMRDREPGRVARALLEASAGQCGFCLAGIAMCIEACLRSDDTTPSSLRTALDAHLCRCGIHNRVLRVASALLEQREASR